MKSQSSFNMAKLVREFIENHDDAKAALADANAAEEYATVLPRELYTFLYQNDIDAELLMVSQIRDVPASGSDALMSKVVKNGAKLDIHHMVVKVNGLIVDLCYKRLGKTFHVYNYPARELKEVFNVIKPAASYLNKGVVSLYSVSATAVEAEFEYKSTQPLNVRTDAGVVKFAKGTLFAFGNKTKTSVLLPSGQRVPVNEKQSLKLQESSKPYIAKALTAAQLKEYDVKDYVWYKYKDATKSNLKDSKGTVVVLFTKGMVFGVKTVGNFDRVLIASDARKIHKITPLITDRLIAKSGEFRGEVKLVNAPTNGPKTRVNIVPTKKRVPPVVSRTTHNVIKTPAKPTRSLTVTLDKDDEESDVDDFEPTHRGPVHVPELDVDDGSDLVEKYRNSYNSSRK